MTTAKLLLECAKVNPAHNEVSVDDSSPSLLCCGCADITVHFYLCVVLCCEQEAVTLLEDLLQEDDDNIELW